MTDAATLDDARRGAAAAPVTLSLEDVRRRVESAPVVISLE